MTRPVPEVLPFSLPPEAAIRHYEAKGLRPTFNWQDMLHEQHAVDFTVAKMTEVDLLETTRQAVADALREGQSFGEFRRQLRPVLQAAGWWGRQERADPATGESRVVQLGSERRLRVIYDTNLRTAMAAGAWQRIETLKSVRPYLRYVAVLDARTRPAHRAWHGIILPVDHPWWIPHYPPCGHNCRCGVQQLSERDLAQQGWTVSPDPVVETRPWTNPRTGAVIQVPAGVDPGWGYHVGAADQAARTARGLMDRLAGAEPRVAAAVMESGGELLRRLVDSDTRAWIERLDTGTAPATGEVRVVGVLPAPAAAAIQVATAGRAAEVVASPASAAVAIDDRTARGLLAGAGELVRGVVGLLARPLVLMRDPASGRIALLARAARGIATLILRHPAPPAGSPARPIAIADLHPGGPAGEGWETLWRRD